MDNDSCENDHDSAAASELSQQCQQVDKETTETTHKNIMDNDSCENDHDYAAASELSQQCQQVKSASTSG